MVRVDSAVFLIDFGLAEFFRNPATYLHIPNSTNHPVIGTLPFTSINGQQGYAQSRRNDLESLAVTNCDTWTVFSFSLPLFIACTITVGDVTDDLYFRM
jgi:serine/threonine protein kinase